MQNRILPLEGVRNFRDFGGYVSRHGGTVKAGHLYRSGHHAEATEADITKLHQLNIALQADLRRPDERERMVGKWTGEAVITHEGGRESEAPHQRFLKQMEASPEIADQWMNEYYIHAPFKPHHTAMFKDWFQGLAIIDGAGLVNCAAGKDRTGILCALTHHVLGVNESDIFADYELTNIAANVDERLEGARDYFNNRLGKNYEADVYRPFMGVNRRYLETALSSIKDQCGSVETYLTDHLGVDEALQSQIVGRLVGD